MNHLNSKVNTVGIFFFATALLVSYLLSMHLHVYLPVSLFWVAVALMLSTITYQCLKIELSPSYAKVVLLEVAVTCFVFHLIYQLPYYGIRGFDAYIDLASSKSILSSGYVMGDPQYINYSSYFPIIHIFGVILSIVSGIDLLPVAKWFPSLLDSVLIIILYLLVRSVFEQERIALLSALLFSCLEHHILFSSLFIRETCALVLAVCCVYFYFSARHSPHPAAKYALSMLCLVETVVAHHLTSFMLLIFLSTHFLVTKASKTSFLRRAYSGGFIEGQKVTITFLLSGFVVLFAYWTYVIMSPLYTLVTFLQSVFNPSRWGVRTYAEIAEINPASIQTMRGYVIFYGFYLFHLIFGLILLYGLLPKAKNRRIETYSFTLFLFVCGLVGFLSLYFIPLAGAFPDRYLMFGWLFGFAPLVASILKGNHKWRQRVGVCLLVAFMLFNVYMIEPIYWDPMAEGVRVVTPKEDYALANRFNFSNLKLFGFQNPIMAIYDVHNNLGTIFAIYEKVNLTNFDYVIIQKKTLELEKIYHPGAETIATLERIANGGDVYYTKIYESGNLLVFKRGQ